jgi:hypothetical protein
MLIGSAIAATIDTENSFRIDVTDAALVLFAVAMAIAVVFVTTVLWRLLRPHSRRRHSRAHSG